MNLALGFINIRIKKGYKHTQQPREVCRWDCLFFSLQSDVIREVQFCHDVFHFLAVLSAHENSDRNLCILTKIQAAKNIKMQICNLVEFL